MTIETRCTCDYCKDTICREINNYLTISSYWQDIHFCNMDCMRSHLEKRWSEMDAEKQYVMNNDNSGWTVTPDRAAGGEAWDKPL